MSGAGKVVRPKRPGREYELQSGVRPFSIRFAPADACTGYEKARARAAARRRKVAP